jgi:MurNAc alpha-1-phosphate uridylyltransferase
MIPPLSDTAMVLAAGLGTRMRPMTLTTPKPLQIVGGKTMLDDALNKLAGIGIRRAVVNTHYLAEQVEAHVRNRRDIEIIISRETELLDTGGAILRALPHFGGKPFFALNADLPWMDGAAPSALPSLARLRDAWHPDKMDALLLLMQTSKARGFSAAGDFAMDASGKVWRKDVPPPRPYVLISAQILKPSLYDNPPGAIFSNNVVWNDAEARGRLYGVAHDGTCYHVGTPEDWRIANDLLASGKGWAV